MFTRIDIILVLPLCLPNDDGRNNDDDRAEGVCHDVQKNAAHVHLGSRAGGRLLLLSGRAFFRLSTVDDVLLVTRVLVFLLLVGQGGQVAVGPVSRMVALWGTAVTVTVPAS